MPGRIRRDNSQGLDTRQALAICAANGHQVTRQALRHISIECGFYMKRGNRVQYREDGLMDYIYQSTHLPPGKGWMRVSKAARLYNLTESRIYQMIKEGLLESTMYGAGRGHYYVKAGRPNKKGNK